MAGIRMENKIYEVGMYCRLSKDVYKRQVHLTTGAIYARLDHLRKKLRKFYSV